MAFDFLADALLRKHEEEMKQQQFKIKSQVNALSSVAPNWVEAINSSIEDSEYVKNMSQKCLLGQLTAEWELLDGLLYYGGKIALDRNSHLIKTMIQEMHAASHEGVDKTLYRIKQDFKWKGMVRSLKKFIRNYHCS